MDAPTASSTTDESGSDEGERRRTGALVLVLESDRLAAGGALLATRDTPRVVVGRGARRASRVVGDGTLRWDVPDPKLSSVHAELRWTPEGWRVRDRGSRNGTFVDGERVGEALVARGAVVRVGHTFLTAVEDVEPAALARDRAAIATLSGPLARTLERVDRLAPSPLPILVLGETGTGKEVVARRIHERSGRPGAFVAVNCGALPKDLVESTLFGHVKGAFSGAVRDEPGFVRAADGGTLFLDEIGELPLTAQTALLRVLQEGEVSPVGAHRAAPVDVRVVAATNRPLDRMLRDGAFRADLYARLAGYVARLPPLRERRQDVGHLCAAFIAEGRLPDVRLRSDAAERLLSHDWPFNVRELLQALQAAALLADGGTVRASDLPDPLVVAASAPAAASTRPLSPEEARLRDDLARRLEASGGNVSQVARDMNKARYQIQRWMKRFGLRK